MNELPDTPMGVIRLLPTKSSEIAVFAHRLITSVRDGYTNPLELHVALKALELLSKEVREEIEESTLREASKYSEKKFQAYGAIVERTDVGTIYNYEMSGDAQWESLDAQIKTLTERKKEREAFLRTLKEPLTTLNEETGEVEQIKPPTKRSKEGIRVYIANIKS